MSEFVYATRDITLSEERVIRQKEIGILIKQEDENAYVHFVSQEEVVMVLKDWVCFFNPEETGDQFSQKVCNRCHRLLNVESFEVNQHGKDNRIVRRPSCIRCREAINGKNVPAAVKREWEKNKPNMVIWECPVCKKKTIPGLTSKVVLDHDHKTGVPRAWICDSCNTGLGRFKDDIEVMEETIEYLKSNQG